MSRSGRQPARGLTLIELITTIVLLGVMASVGALMLVESVEAWNQFVFRADTGMQARLGLDLMVREIRETDVTSLGAPIVATASATTYAFTHTLEGGTNENVTYSWNGTSGAPLLRGSTTLIPRVSSLAFSYYDKNDVALTPLPLTGTNLANVRRVAALLTIQNDTMATYTMNIKGEALLRAPTN